LKREFTKPFERDPLDGGLCISEGENNFSQMVLQTGFQVKDQRTLTIA